MKSGWAVLRRRRARARLRSAGMMRTHRDKDPNSKALHLTTQQYEVLWISRKLPAINDVPIKSIKVLLFASSVVIRQAACSLHSIRIEQLKAGWPCKDMSKCILKIFLWLTCLQVGAVVRFIVRIRGSNHSRLRPSNQKET